MTVGDRIKQARDLRGMTRDELCLAAGIKYPTLAGIENGDQANSTKLPEIARALDVRVMWLKTGKGPIESGASDDQDWSDIQGFRQGVALGHGSVPDEYAESHKLKFRADSLQRKGLKPANLAVYYGRGDSMEPRIKDGDAILFDTNDNRPADGCIFIVSYDGHLMAKRLIKIGEQWCLASENTADPQWRKPIPIDMNNGFEVRGRVRWIGSWED